MWPPWLIDMEYADFGRRLIWASLTIVGVWTLFGKGMILGWLGDVLDRVLPALLQKPLYACLPCMSSIWGTAFWILSDGTLDIHWPIFCLALCGILKIVSTKLLHNE